MWKETDGRYDQIYEYTGHDVSAFNMLQTPQASVNGVAFAPPAHGLVLATAGADCQVLLFLINNYQVTIITFDPTSGNWSPKQIIKAHEQVFVSFCYLPLGCKCSHLGTHSAHRNVENSQRSHCFYPFN